MAKLSNIITKYSGAELIEENLEIGRISYFSMNGNQEAYFCCGIQWRAPCSGTAIIELWGAAGSGSKMCCCGIGLPGNPGAYAKRTVKVDGSTWICMGDNALGFSCGNYDSLCFRGCSDPARITVCSPNGTLTGPTGSSVCFCMCAQGGMSGLSLCMESCSPYCRYRGCNMCVTNTGTGCGIVCNYGSSYNFLPNAYGGDVNCTGEFSCLIVNNCNMCCSNCFIAHVRTSAGVWGDDPQTIIHHYSCTNMQQHMNSGYNHYISALHGMSRTPTYAQPTYTCYDSNMYCGCYEWNGCTPMVSHGIPGYGGMTCSGIRDGGARGAHGALKIRFIAD